LFYDCNSILFRLFSATRRSRASSIDVYTSLFTGSSSYSDGYEFTTFSTISRRCSEHPADARQREDERGVILTGSGVCNTKNVYTNGQERAMTRSNGTGWIIFCM